MDITHCIFMQRWNAVRLRADNLEARRQAPAGTLSARAARRQQRAVQLTYDGVENTVLCCGGKVGVRKIGELFLFSNFLQKLILFFLNLNLSFLLNSSVMATTSPVVKVAVVQAASVAFDVVGSIAKLARLAKEARAAGARLVLFPEAFVSCYPRGASFGAVVGSRSPEGTCCLGNIISKYFIY